MSKCNSSPEQTPTGQVIVVSQDLTVLCDGGPAEEPPIAELAVALVCDTKNDTISTPWFSPQPLEMLAERMEVKLFDPKGDIQERFAAAWKRTLVHLQISAWISR